MLKDINLRAIIAMGLLFAFLVNTLGPLPSAYAQEFVLPAPGQMVALSPAFSPAVLKGIKLDPKNPFRFHFFVDKGDSNPSQEELKQESSKLIKYFLAALTIPEKDLWVNLSPYEKDRIVPQEFGQTEMGRDLLAQDYLLKQITASIMYPESQLGKEFWKKVYDQAQAKYGTTNIPINTFNKVWIVPEKAVVYENGGVAFVLENHLKVMLEQDYLSLQKHTGIESKKVQAKDTSALGSQIVREIVIPALTKEVNEGKNFAQLRQVFYSLILATWYKKKIKDSILNRVYSNRKKTAGVDIYSDIVNKQTNKQTNPSLSLSGLQDRPSSKVIDPQSIYQRYLQAFKKGVYNYIKEEPDPLTNQTIPRKYFSGGVEAKLEPVIEYRNLGKMDFAQVTSLGRLTEITGETRLKEIGDKAQLSQVLSAIVQAQSFTDDQIDFLEKNLLEDPVQRAFIIQDGRTNREIIVERAKVLQKCWQGFSAWWKSYLKTDLVPIDTLWRFYIPFCQWMVAQKRIYRPHGVYVMGMQANPGVGKTTLTNALINVLSVLLEPSEGQTLVLSIDDYYLLKAQRDWQRPRFEAEDLKFFRAPPGTHDIERILEDLKKFDQSTPESVTETVRFDKSIDDRSPTPQIIKGKVGIVLFEGLIMGANTDFNLEDLPQGVKRVVGEELKKYKPIFDLLDDVVYFKIPRQDVAAGRIAQERLLDKKMGRALVVSDAEIRRYVDYLTRGIWAPGLTSPVPKTSDTTFKIIFDNERKVIEVIPGGRVHIATRGQLAQLEGHFDRFWRDHQLDEPGRFPQELVAKGKIGPGMNVLSLGAGRGQNELFFAKSGASVLAVDISTQAVSILNQKAVELNLEQSLRAVRDDFTVDLLPLQDQTFDAVFAYQSLLYFNDDQMRKIIKNMFRLLKPKGRVFVSVRAMDDFKFVNSRKKTGKNTAIGPEDDIERRFFDEAELRNLFTQGGFNNISITKELLPRFGPVSSVYSLSAEKEDAFKSRATTDPDLAMSADLKDIYNTFKKGDLYQSHQALQRFLKLDIENKDKKMVFNILQVAGPYKEIVATYALTHMFLFGVDIKGVEKPEVNQNWGEVATVLSRQATNIYFYLLNIDLTQRRGGSVNRNCDTRIKQYSKFLDLNSEEPSDLFSTWFSDLRRQIHRSINYNSFYFVGDVLTFWKTMDRQILISAKQKDMWRGPYQGVLEDQNSLKYSKIFNALLRDLGINDKNFLEQILMLDEDHVVEVLRKVCADKLKKPRSNLLSEYMRSERYIVDQMEYAIRLYFALNEKFRINLPRVVKEIKEFKSGTDFMPLEYAAFVEAVDRNDGESILETGANLRNSIREYLLTHPVAKGNDRQLERINDLLELDHNVHFIGQDALNRVFNQQLQQVRTMEDVESNLNFLIAAARFLHASGVGGVDFEQYLDVLQHGDLTYSQLYDLFRLLEKEILKFLQSVHKNVHFVLPSILKNEETIRGLKSEWYPYQRMSHGSIDIVSSRNGLENSLEDLWMRDSGISVLKAALMKMEQVLKAYKGEDKLVRRAATDNGHQERSLDQLFLPFNQGLSDYHGEPRLLSYWGKKGRNTVHMIEEGMPVPPGVIVSAQLMDAPAIIDSEAFKAKITQEIEQLRGQARKLGHKLFLYARGGTAFMLPGLITTISNIGMNDQEAAELAKTTGDMRFAYDTYASFIRSFGIHVLGIDEIHFQEILNTHKKGIASGVEMKTLVSQYKQVVLKYGKGRKIPETMVDQVTMAIKAIYASWNSPAIKVYRLRHNVSDRWGTSVILQMAIFGNKSETKDHRISGTGSAALIMTKDGVPTLQGKFIYREQGEQIMSEAGKDTVHLSNYESPVKNGHTFQDLNPDLYQKILKEALRLKESFEYNQLLEFTIENGEVWILQTNDYFILENVSEFIEPIGVHPIAQGQGLGGGAVRGWVANSIEDARKLDKRYRLLKQRGSPEIKGVDGVILILDFVKQEMIDQIPPGVHLLVRDISIHALTLAQSEGITVVATEEKVKNMNFDMVKKEWVIGGRRLANGDVISMDGHWDPFIYHSSGKIYLGSLPTKTDKAMSIPERKRHLRVGIVGSDQSIFKKGPHDNRTMTISTQKRGGIDLNPAQMSMQVKKDGQDFKFDFNGTEIDAAQVTGATFTIRTMTPVTNLPMLLGLSKSNSIQELALQK